MLQKLNEGIKGWVATVIVVAISASFLVFGVSYYLNSRSGSSATIVKVGSAVITNKQLQLALRREQFTRERTHGALSKRELKFLKNQVLNALIQQDVRQQALDRLGLKAPKQAVEQAIQSLPAFQQDGRYNPDLLKVYLSNSGSTLQQLMQQVSHELVMQQLSMGISFSSAALPQAILAKYQWAEQTRRYRYVRIAPTLFRSGLKVTAEDLQAYYQAHQDDYKLPERVLIRYVTLNPQEIAKTIPLSSTEMQQYYNVNKNQFRLPATYRYAQVVVLKPEAGKSSAQQEKQTQGINAALKSGSQLRVVASRFGGSVQSTSADKLNPSVLALLQTMRSGQVLSEQPVQVGTLWLQLISVKPGEVKPFAAVKSRIKAQLASQKVRTKMAPMTETLSDVSYTQSSSLEPAAKALGLVVKQSAWVTKSGDKTGFFANKKLINAAFSDEVLKQGNNSMPVSLADGSVVVLRVKQLKKEELRPLAEVRAQVLTHVKDQAAQLQAALFAATLKKALQQKKPLSPLLRQHHLTWKQVAAVKRSDKVADPAVLKAAFSYATAPTVATLADGEATTLVQLQAINQPTGKPTAAQKGVFIQSVRSFYSEIDKAAVILSVEKQIPIKRYLDRMG
jgi:peptidyl-prolyl cis-trans isomerase D